MFIFPMEEGQLAFVLKFNVYCLLRIPVKEPETIILAVAFQRTLRPCTHVSETYPDSL